MEEALTQISEMELSETASESPTQAALLDSSQIKNQKTDASSLEQHVDAVFLNYAELSVDTETVPPVQQSSDPSHSSVSFFLALALAGDLAQDQAKRANEARRRTRDPE